MHDEDKEALLKLARESIETSFTNVEPDINSVLHLKDDRGVFVTLHKNGDLRGCIGYPEPIMPLYKAIIEASRSAAFQDPRFPVLTKDELSRIKIEISVLTEPEEIDIEKPSDYSKEIKIGRDGLIIRSREGSGLLLPQVASDYNWTVPQFLNALCQKAGLSFNAWQNRENHIYKFQAEVFSEE